MEFGLGLGGGKRGRRGFYGGEDCSWLILPRRPDVREDERCEDRWDGAESCNKLNAADDENLCCELDDISDDEEEIEFQQQDVYL